MWAIEGMAVLLIAAVAVGFCLLRPRSHPAPKVVPFTRYPGRQITPASSPDAMQVAFAWDGEKGDNFDIYIKLADAGAPLKLTNNPANEYGPAWARDGRRLSRLLGWCEQNQLPGSSVLDRGGQESEPANCRNYKADNDFSHP
jgi:hypothetical protein